MPTKKSNPEPPEQASTEPTAAKVGSPDVDATKNEDGTSTKPQKTPQELWDSLDDMSGVLAEMREEGHGGDGDPG